MASDSISVQARGIIAPLSDVTRPDPLPKASQELGTPRGIVVMNH